MRNYNNGFEYACALDKSKFADESEYYKRGPVLWKELFEFSRDPQTYKQRTDQAERDVKPAYDFDYFNPDEPKFKEKRAVEDYILLGREYFKSRYEVFSAPVNPQTQRAYGPNTKKFEQAYEEARKAAFHNKALLSREQYQLVQDVAESLLRNESARELVGTAPFAESRIYAVGALRTNDALDVPVRAEIPRYSEHGLVVLKYVDSLDKLGFSYVKNLQYDKRLLFELGFYHLTLTDVLGAPFVPIHVVAVELGETRRVCPFTLAPNCAEAVRVNVRTALTYWERARRSGLYLSPFSSVVQIDRVYP